MNKIIAIVLCVIFFSSFISQRAYAWPWGKAKNVAVAISIDNRTGERAVVFLKVKDKEDNTLRSIEKAIEKDKILKLSESIPTNGAIKWQYSIGSIKARFDLEPREIQKDHTTSQEITETLIAVDKYNDAETIEKLKKIAKDLHLDLAPIPLSSAEKRLGIIWVGDPKEKKRKGFSWKMKDIEITQGGKISFHSTTNLLGSTLVSASLNVPIYGSLSGNFESNSIYKVDWKAEHFEFPNTDLQKDPFEEASNTVLGQMKRILKSNENYTLCYIDTVHVINYLSYASTKGTKVSSSVSSAYLSIFTADASYIFDARSTDVQTMTRQVVGEEIACAPRDQVMALIEDKLNPGPGGLSGPWLTPDTKFRPSDGKDFEAVRIPPSQTTTDF